MGKYMVEIKPLTEIIMDRLNIADALSHADNDRARGIYDRAIRLYCKYVKKPTREIDERIAIVDKHLRNYAQAK